MPADGRWYFWFEDDVIQKPNISYKGHTEFPDILTQLINDGWIKDEDDFLTSGMWVLYKTIPCANKTIPVCKEAGTRFNWAKTHALMFKPRKCQQILDHKCHVHEIDKELQGTYLGGGLNHPKILGWNFKEGGQAGYFITDRGLGSTKKTVQTTCPECEEK